jgi:signal transduction histidine kinase
MAADGTGETGKDMAATVDGMIEALNKANRRLIAAETEAEVAEVLSDAATTVLDFPGTGVRLYDPEENTLVHQSFGATVDDIETRPTYDVDASPHGRAFRRGETVVDDIGADDPYERDTFTQTIYVPVGQYGILSAGKTEAPFRDTEVRIAEILARNGRVAFDRAVERRDLERSLARLRDQNERLEELSKLLTHDIRNPLNVAQGNVNLLQQRQEAEELDTVERTLDRMGQLVDEVLTLLDDDRRVTETERVVLRRLGRRCWATVETDGATLHVEGDAVVEADPSRLRHVFENLFRNAVEHASTSNRTKCDNAVEHGSTSGDGGPTVWLGAAEDGFYVEDDGPGIPPEKRDTVFESGHTTSRDGTGFGLAIVEDMVSAHGWTVSVTCGRAGGARFEVTGLESSLTRQ